MQLVQSHDSVNRVSFKDSLASKVEAALAPVQEDSIPEDILLLLPSNFQELNGTALHFSLMHNVELKHSRESATMAVNIVQGKMLRPKNVSFKTVELSNPVEIPEFEKPKTVKRSAPRQITPQDSTQARLEAEEVKRSEYEHYLSNLFQRALNDESLQNETKETTLRVPSNWNDLSEQELFFTLTHQTELEHSRTSAYLAMDILSNKISKPENVTLQEVVIFRPVSEPKPEFQVQTIQKPKRIELAQSVEIVPTEQVLLLPEHYKDLSEAGLFYTLTHNPELKHSHDSATLAINVVYSKISKPEWVSFQTINLTKPESVQIEKTVKPDPLKGFIPQREIEKRTALKAYLAGQTDRVLQTKPQKDEEIILRLPKNYKELSQDDLLQVLTRHEGYKHTPQSSYLALDILAGKIAQPANVKFRTVNIPAPTVKPVILSSKVIEASIHPDVLANEETKKTAHEEFLAGQAERAAQPIEANTETILRLPKNYKELSEDALLEVLTRHPGYKHTRNSAYLALDILSGKVAKPEWVVFHTVNVPAPEIKPVTLSAPKKVETFIHPEVFANEEEKRIAQGEKVEAVPVYRKEEDIVLRIPENYQSLSHNELLYVLLNTTELAHTRDSAYNAIDILSGVIAKPENVTLQAVASPGPVAVTAPRVEKTPRPATVIHPLQDEASREKREQHKEFLAEKARVAYNTKPVFSQEEVRTVLLPEGYDSMNPGELHFALIHNPEFKHTNQQAIVTADMLSGRIGTPENVVFQTVKVENLQTAPTVKTHGSVKDTGIKAGKTEATLLTRAQIPMGEEGERVLLLPHNFEDLTETQLHFALSHNREYKHSYESTYETLDIVFGRKASPKGTVFSTVDVKNPVERAY